MNRTTISRAVQETRPLLIQHGPAAGQPAARLRTLADISAYAASQGQVRRWPADSELAQRYRPFGGQLQLPPSSAMIVSSVSFDASPSGSGRVRKRRQLAGREAPPPRPPLVKAALVVIGAGIGATSALAITAETTSQLAAPGGQATFAGNLTGLVGTYLALVMVLLVSRIPFVERVLGQDGLLRWHRRLAPWPISLLIAHAVFLTVGYAQAARSGIWHQAGVLVTQYPDVLLATAGLGLMCTAGAISVRAVRSRLRRETWWLVHL